MDIVVHGLGKIPLLPINSEDLKTLADVLKGYLAYVQVVHLLAKGEESFLFSVHELKALKEAAYGFVTLMTCIVPQSDERDGVIESLQALAQQFSLMLSPLVN
jgi:hypothetical protein